jgi:hypothetical protein
MVGSKVGTFVLGAALAGFVGYQVPHREYITEHDALTSMKQTIVAKNAKIDELTEKILNADFDCMEKMQRLNQMFMDMKADNDKTSRSVSDIHRHARNVFSQQDSVLSEVKQIVKCQN